MSVRLTRIYTRTGDDGTTGIADFSRLPKSDVRIEAIGNCDAVNAALGVVVALGQPEKAIVATLRRIQNEIFDLGADLARPIADDENAGTSLRVTDEYVGRLERDCDEFNSGLPALTSFVLPGGTPAAALLHSARTIARQAERSVWKLLESEPTATNPLTARYLNRLSDLLFILGRAANGGRDVLWIPGGER